LSVEDAFSIAETYIGKSCLRTWACSSRASSDAKRCFEQKKAKLDLRIDELKYVAWKKGKFIRGKDNPGFRQNMHA
jgi:hypothetical protein